MGNSKKILLGIIISLILLLIGIGIGFGVYKLTSNNEMDKVENINNETENSENGEQDLIEQKIEKLLENDYEEVNITNNLNINFANNAKSLRKVENNNNYESIIYLENNIGYLSDGNQKLKINVNNIKNIYILENVRTDSVIDIYLLTSDGDIYYLLSNIYNNGIENDINNFKKINTKYKYNELKEWYFNTSPVGNVIALVGITSDEKQMLISTGMGVLYNEIEFKQDDVKANINSCVVSKSDYLYKTYEDFSNDKKIQNSKINKVFKKEIEGIGTVEYTIIFDNGEEAEC